VDCVEVAGTMPRTPTGYNREERLSDNDTEAMMESRPDRKPARDYRACSGTAWPMMDAVYARKSQRKYVPHTPPEEFASELEEVVALACEARGALRESIVAITERSAVDSVRDRCYRGITGRINMWLGRQPLVAFLVLDVPGRDLKAQRPLALPHTVMAAEDVVLWLTERGLGTCWLGGVSTKEVISAAGLGVASAVPSIISVGKPAQTKAASYAGVTERVQSRRRKPLADIAASETCDTPYVAAGTFGSAFSASPDGVHGLLEVMAGRKPSEVKEPASLELAVEACLEAGRVAPSGANSQPWVFVVVREKRKLEMLAKACRADDIAGRQAAIVALSSVRKFETVLLDKPFWMIDLPIALSHVSLMAASAGYPPAVFVDNIDEQETGAVVGAPAAMRTVGVVGL
jgi:nitroreductase